MVIHYLIVHPVFNLYYSGRRNRVLRVLLAERFWPRVRGPLQLHPQRVHPPARPLHARLPRRQKGAPGTLPSVTLRQSFGHILWVSPQSITQYRVVHQFVHYIFRHQIESCGLGGSTVTEVFFWCQQKLVYNLMEYRFMIDYIHPEIEFIWSTSLFLQYVDPINLKKEEL